MTMTTNAPNRIFVSHSHEDRAFTQQLVEALKSVGADVWYDEDDLKPGRLVDTIRHQLRERNVFLVVLSPAASRSSWMQSEMREAVSTVSSDPSRKVVPILAAENVVLPPVFDHVQAIDFTGQSSSAALSQLLHTLDLWPTQEGQRARIDQDATLSPTSIEGMDSYHIHYRRSAAFRLVRGTVYYGQFVYSFYLVFALLQLFSIARDEGVTVLLKLATYERALFPSSLLQRPLLSSLILLGAVVLIFVGRWAAVDRLREQRALLFGKMQATAWVTSKIDEESEPSQSL